MARVDPNLEESPGASYSKSTGDGRAGIHQHIKGHFKQKGLGDSHHGENTHLFLSLLG